jgi:hypothetical protein
MSGSSPQDPFGEALVTAVRGLWRQPPLLAAVAMAIILAAVAVAAGDAARMIAIPLLLLLVAGLIAWVYSDARRAQQRKPGVFQAWKPGAWSKQDDVEIEEGDIDVGPGARVEQNFEPGAGSQQSGVRIKRGKVRIRKR